MEADQIKFVEDMARECDTHEKWLTMMRFAEQKLVTEQRLLLTLIHEEALREVERIIKRDSYSQAASDKEAAIVDAVIDIFDELELQIKFN